LGGFFLGYSLWGRCLVTLTPNVPWQPLTNVYACRPPPPHPSSRVGNCTVDPKGAVRTLCAHCARAVRAPCDYLRVFQPQQWCIRRRGEIGYTYRWILKAWPKMDLRTSKYVDTLTTLLPLASCGGGLYGPILGPNYRIHYAVQRTMRKKLLSAKPLFDDL